MYEAGLVSNFASRFPLHAAAASGRDDAVVDLLLARGGCARYVADAVDGDGLTALHHAAAAGKWCIGCRACGELLQDRQSV